MSHISLTEAIVNRARAGSPNALSALFRRYGGELLAAAIRLTGSPELAERVVQDVFVGLPTALRAYDATLPLHVWLRRITVRVAVLRMRQPGDDRPGPSPRRRLRLVPPRFSAAVGPGGRGPAEAKIEPETLGRSVSELPELPRLVFVLRGIEGYSHEEIAELLGISPRQSRNEFHRARAFLARAVLPRS